MTIREQTEATYNEHTDGLAKCAAFQTLEAGTSEPAAYDHFIANVCTTHLRSPQILAFLFSVSPPNVADHIKHNMLEELGLDDEGISHPSLLLKLAEAAGFSATRREELQELSQAELRRRATTPLLFGTIKEVGLSALLETVSFEWMLSRLAGRMATFLETHRHLNADAIKWFSHHSEVDIRHADEGLDAVVAYAEYYDFNPSDVESILELTFRENVFIKRYFGSLTLARETGLLR
jgi:hypothetical protein